MDITTQLSDEQKLYLDGFIAGLLRRRGGADGLSSGGEPVPAGPEAVHRVAQDRTVAAGGVLVAEEKAKRERHPLDRWDDLRAQAAAGNFPKGIDVFLTKFFGLFYVAPAQNAFMCRLRMPNGILDAHQFRGLADIAERLGGGYADVTTRANLQIREIKAESAVAVLTGIQDLGLTSRGSGADNIRNVTGSPTAGIDPDEMIDTRPLASEMHHYILNHREMYGLPRKFNIAFDGGGRIPVLEDTNDIGFVAVRVEDGHGIEPGVYFRLQLGGITGHQTFAADTGVLLRPEECVPVAAAIVRVYIEHGDRTNRAKARMKYLIDRWGLEKFVAESEALLPFKLRRVSLSACAKRPRQARDGHIGVHAQRQADLSYIGVVLPVGRLTAGQMRGLADIAATHGSGTLRLTVWQNLLISDIPDAEIPAVQAALGALGLGWSASAIRAGLVACTGNSGCKFAAGDTKRHALELATHLEAQVPVDTPLNIHLTGCHHSCAQHYVGDIGLLATKVGEDAVEGYHISVGGGAGPEQALARDIFRDVPFAEVPARVEGVLRTYLGHRRDADKSFHAFASRHSVDDLRALCGEAVRA